MLYQNYAGIMQTSGKEYINANQRSAIFTTADFMTCKYDVWELSEMLRNNQKQPFRFIKFLENRSRN
jgi:hypothetical protein